MSEIRTWKCDGSGCGTIRKESNNWWMLNHDGQGFMLRPFDDQLARSHAFQFCGLACALRKISELAGGEAK